MKRKKRKMRSFSETKEEEKKRGGGTWRSHRDNYGKEKKRENAGGGGRISNWNFLLQKAWGEEKKKRRVLSVNKRKEGKGVRFSCWKEEGGKKDLKNGVGEGERKEVLIFIPFPAITRRGKRSFCDGD